MTNKLPLLVGTLALSTIALAGPKSYDIVLLEPMKAGNAELVRGEYKVKVEGSTAVFTNTHTRQSLSVPVKVDNADQKFDVTAIDTSKQGNEQQIKSIQLGGSKTKLEFDQ
jgi:hypothetical protein